MASAGQQGVTRALDRIRSVLDSGSSYEAQQMFKTAYHRYKAKQQLEESYTILREGAIMQLRSRQLTCGIELALLLIEAYTAAQVNAGDEQLAAVREIVTALPSAVTASPAEADAAGPQAPSAPSADPDAAALGECSRFAAAAVKWATKFGGAGAAREVHDMFALFVWKACGWPKLAKATAHFVRGADASAFASVLRACITQAGGREADLFVARAVLQALATAQRRTTVQQLQYARALLARCKALDAQQGQRQLDTPLVHFVELLLQALARRSTQLVSLLRDRYERALEADPVLDALVERVEQVYLGVGGQGGFGGLLGGLLKSMTGMDAGGDGDEGSSEEEDEDEEDQEEDHYADAQDA